MIAQIPPRVEVLSDLCLPPDDDAREQIFHSGPSELVPTRLDRSADDLGGTTARLCLDRPAVEAHLRRDLFRFRSPIDASPCRERPLPVQPFDIIGVVPEVFAPRPEHRVVDMKSDGDILLPGYGKGIVDEAIYLSVGMIERERSEDDRQPGLAIANTTDPADDVLNEGGQLLLGGHGAEGMHPRTADCHCRVRRTGEDLKGQITRLHAVVSISLGIGNSDKQQGGEDSHDVYGFAKGFYHPISFRSGENRLVGQALAQFHDLSDMEDNCPDAFVVRSWMPYCFLNCDTCDGLSQRTHPILMLKGVFEGKQHIAFYRISGHVFLFSVYGLTIVFGSERSDTLWLRRFAIHE